MSFSRQCREPAAALGRGLALSLLTSAPWLVAQTPTAPAHSPSTTIPTTQPGREAPQPAVAPLEPESEAHSAGDTLPGADASNVKQRTAAALALTVSGAVSLGSHEAGQLFMITEALRESPQSTPLRVTTGASAGSANALISGTEACLNRHLQAEESIGYRAWVNTGLENLFDPTQTTRQAMFHMGALNAAYGELTDLWRQGLPEDCSFAYGAAVTRKSAVDIKVAEGLVIPRSAERFVVRLTGQKAGPPRFTNYVDQQTSHNRPLLPITGTFQDDAAAVKPVVLASAAFPVAFPPQPIEHCTSGDSAGQCLQATEVDFFVDGGVFDNNPLGIAYRIARGGLTQEGARTTLREKPDGTQPEDLDVLYGYVDPDLRTYPLYRPRPNQEDPATEDPVVGLVTRLGGQMLENARGHELERLADENFGLLQDLWLLRANFPPISELLGAFFGFFERDFRDFDFYLGTYDSFVDLRDKSATRLGAEEYIQKLDATLQGDPKKVPVEYRKLACILAHVGEREYQHLSGLCQGDDLRNFRILLQVAVDRLWSNCRLLSKEEVAATEHRGCRRAGGGLPAPVVDPTLVVRGERYQGRTESQFDYALRLLSDYKFHFKDLGLPAAKAGASRVAVRRKLIAMVEALADAQRSPLDRTVVMTAGRSLVNTIYYEPPQKRGYLGVGSSVFGGYLGRLGDLRTLYFNVDARMLNLRELLSNATFQFSAQASAGLEYAILPLSGSFLQTSLGVRGGYQFSSTDGIGLDPCVATNVANDSRRCSGPVIHAPVNVTLLERVRLAVTPIFYPLPQDFGHNWFELEVGVAAELF